MTIVDINGKEWEINTLKNAILLSKKFVHSSKVNYYYQEEGLETIEITKELFDKLSNGVEISLKK